MTEKDTINRGIAFEDVTPFDTPVPRQSEPRIYRIRRYRRAGGGRTIRSNVTLTEAQSHCSQSDTKGAGWFDGYDYMPGCAPKK